MFKPLPKAPRRKFHGVIVGLWVFLLLLTIGVGLSTAQLLPLPRLPVYQQAKIPKLNDSNVENTVISADGKTIVTSAELASQLHNQGAAWIYRADGLNWILEDTLTDAVEYSRFGRSIDLSADGNTLIIGASMTNVGANEYQGTAYIYTRTSGTWGLPTQLFADDGAEDDMFGYGVALSDDGNTALVIAIYDDASKGSGYIFVRQGETWVQEGKLSPNNPNPVATVGFGTSLALSADGNTALIGTSNDDITTDETIEHGSASVYVRNNGVWTSQAWLTMDDANQGDGAGRSVALSADGNTALIGAWRVDSDYETHPETNEGAAYVFIRNGDTWTQQAKLVKANGNIEERAGTSVALSDDGNTAMMGVPGNYVLYTGSAELFTRSGNQWSYSHALIAVDDPQLNRVGFDVSFNNDASKAAVLAPQYGVYVFGEEQPPTPTPTNTPTATPTDPPTSTPASFSLLTPQNEAVISDPAPEFTWTDYPGATTFRFRVRDSFNATVANVSLNPTDICADGVCRIELEELDAVLENNELYSWRVNINNGEVVSEEFTFTTNFAVPGNFNLLTPANNIDVNSSAPVFSWAESENAAEYRLRVLDSFDQRIINTTISSTTTPSVGDICQDGICTFDSSVLGIALEHNEDYEWNVRAKNTFGKKKALPFEFTVVLPLPGAFDLLTPLDNSNVETITPILTWEESIGATEYRVRMKNDTDDTPVFKLNGITPAICSESICTLDTAIFTYLIPLENGESYLWKVQGRNSYGKQKSTQKLTFNVVIPGLQASKLSNQGEQLQLPSTKGQ